MQVIRSSPVYDVVVIGSGAGGGTMVKVLTDLGVNVALIEAGPMLHPAKDFKEHMWPYQMEDRGAGKGGATYFGNGPAFGDAFAFRVGSDGFPGTKRAYKSFDDAAKEAGRSRIYGGIHFECDNREGQKLGRAIAEEVCRTRLLKEE